MLYPGKKPRNIASVAGDIVYGPAISLGDDFVAAMRNEFDIPDPSPWDEVDREWHPEDTQPDNKPTEEDMTFDEAMEVLGVVLPVLGTLLAAKLVNAKTPHWTLWSGRIGKIAGLVIEFLDLLRAPKKVAEKLKDTGNTLPLLLVLFTMVGAGCNSSAWKGVVDDSAKRVYTTAKSISDTFLPTVGEQCVSLAEKCGAAGDKECPDVKKCLAVYDALSKGCESAMAASWSATVLTAINDSGGAFDAIATAVAELTKVVKSMKGDR